MKLLDGATYIWYPAISHYEDEKKLFSAKFLPTMCQSDDDVAFVFSVWIPKQSGEVDPRFSHRFEDEIGRP